MLHVGHALVSIQLVSLQWRDLDFNDNNHAERMPSFHSIGFSSVKRLLAILSQLLSLSYTKFPFNWFLFSEETASACSSTIKTMKGFPFNWFLFSEETIGGFMANNTGSGQVSIQLVSLQWRDSIQWMWGHQCGESFHSIGFSSVKRHVKARSKQQLADKFPFNWFLFSEETFSSGPTPPDS